MYNDVTLVSVKRTRQGRDVAMRYFAARLQLYFENAL